MSKWMGAQSISECAYSNHGDCLSRLCAYQLYDNLDLLWLFDSKFCLTNCTTSHRKINIRKAPALCRSGRRSRTSVDVFSGRLDRHHRLTS